MDESQARFLIAHQLGVAPASVTDATSLAALGADPLDVVALVLELERAFGVRVSDTQAEACRTVGDLLEAVRSGRPLRRPALAAAPLPA